MWPWSKPQRALRVFKFTNFNISLAYNSDLAIKLGSNFDTSSYCNRLCGSYNTFCNNQLHKHDCCFVEVCTFTIAMFKKKIGFPSYGWKGDVDKRWMVSSLLHGQCYHFLKTHYYIGLFGELLWWLTMPMSTMEYTILGPFFFCLNPLLIWNLLLGI